MRSAIKHGALAGAILAGSAFVTQAAACGPGSRFAAPAVPAAGMFELEPDEPWEALLARELEEGQLRDSRGRLEAVLEAEPQNVSARLALGAVLVHEDRRDDAIAGGAIGCGLACTAERKWWRRIVFRSGDQHGSTRPSCESPRSAGEDRGAGCSGAVS